MSQCSLSTIGLDDQHILTLLHCPCVARDRPTQCRGDRPRTRGENDAPADPVDEPLVDDPSPNAAPLGPKPSIPRVTDLTLPRCPPAAGRRQRRSDAGCARAKHRARPRSRRFAGREKAKGGRLRADRAWLPPSAPAGTFAGHERFLRASRPHLGRPLHRPLAAPDARSGCCTCNQTYGRLRSFSANRPLFPGKLP